jgi:UDP-N-acetylmuramoylalanine--D-glutamate ligase
MTRSWKGLRVLILGAARQGLALARYLVRSGAEVTLNDQRSVEQLAEAQRAMQDYAVRWVVGEHPLSLLDTTDLVCLSGGVPLTLPIVVEAEKRGLPVSNDSQIFMEVVPCRVVGITGSAGKTTTTTLVGRMAQAEIQAPRRAWVGGNIGLPLIDFVEQISPDDLVILELSSFQLEQMTVSPQVAAVLNITPNHLDRHGTLEAYAAAKAHILNYQTANDIAVLGREEPGSWALAKQVLGQVISFGIYPLEPGQRGTFVKEGWVCWTNGVQEERLIAQDLIQLRGQHNLMNVAAACAIARAAGFSTTSMAAGITGFGGVSHRLELVREWRGVKWYNDSIATAPERTMAALRSFNEPLVLLLGGRDKKLPWSDLADLIRERVDHVVVFGEAANLIAEALGDMPSGKRPYSLTHCSGLHEAVQATAAIVEKGDVVLLSPGCTSFDEFKDFEERGRRFQEWVNQLS